MEDTKTNNKTEELPEEISGYFGEYGARIFDSWCGEPISWGFKPKVYLGSEIFGKCSKYGDWECAYPSWYLITKKLTREKAIEKYGPVTEERGPRGGFISDKFGEKKFGTNLSKNK